MRCCGRVLSFEVTVQKDDTVDSIAGKLGLPRDVLLSANGGPFCAVRALLRHTARNNQQSAHIWRCCLKLLCLSKHLLRSILYCLK